MSSKPIKPVGSRNSPKPMDSFTRRPVRAVLKALVASERAVQTAKNILRMADDPQIALLSYRTTPIINGNSPAQLLMGRQLRSNVPTFQLTLQLSTPDAVQQCDNAIKTRQSSDYNRRHRAKKGRQWVTGDKVWVADQKTTATVTDVLPFRSYQLRTTSGMNPAKRPNVMSHAAAKAAYHVVVYVSYGADLDANADSDAITAVTDNSAAAIRSTQQMPHPRRSTDSGTASIATSCSSPAGAKDPGVTDPSVKNPVANRRYAIWSASPTSRAIQTLMLKRGGCGGDALLCC
jgi:hypothetical protein